MSAFAHRYPFDPSYGYTPASLLDIEAPPEPPDFAEFWEPRYHSACKIDPDVQLIRSTISHPDWEVQECRYQSTNDFTVGGWVLLPRKGEVRRAFVVGHGYGGREMPDMDLPVQDAAIIFPCCRGISRSRRAYLSSEPAWHVLHDIEDRDRYIIGGCVEDLWVAVSAITELFPAVKGHIGYMGVSFGGGVGALALAWEGRVARGHLNVPTFGHAPLRLQLPTTGSGAAVQAYSKHRGDVLKTLAYFDAAVAARRVRMPMHVAAALFDPAVAPPGQFAIYNALPGTKKLFTLPAGHFEYAGKAEIEQKLREDLQEFFATL